jgi:CTP-dependent riboflavin kinase
VLKVSITRGESTSVNLLHIVWTALATEQETGNSQILSYNVQYQVSGTWVSAVGESTHYLQTEAYITDNVVAG